MATGWGFWLIAFTVVEEEFLVSFKSSSPEGQKLFLQIGKKANLSNRAIVLIGEAGPTYLHKVKTTMKI